MERNYATSTMYNKLNAYLVLKAPRYRTSFTCKFQCMQCESTKQNGCEKRKWNKIEGDVVLGKASAGIIF